MAKGQKTGGREKGTPNKERKELFELLSDKYPDYHPVVSMEDIANDLKQDKTLRFQANKEVAKYICPQLKAVEVASDNREVTIRVFHDKIPK